MTAASPLVAVDHCPGAREHTCAITHALTEEGQPTQGENQPCALSHSSGQDYSKGGSAQWTLCAGSGLQADKN